MPKKPFYHTGSFLTFLSFGFVLLLWEVLTRIFKIPKWLLPGPTLICRELWNSAGILWQNTLVTGSEIVQGFVLALIGGIVLGTIIAYSPFLEKTLYKLLAATQAMPKAALAPLLVIWLGLGHPAKLAMVFLMCFFPVMVSMVTGLQSTSRELLELAEVLGSNWLQSFLKIRFPAALPYLISGVKVAASLSVVGAVISEFVNADKGLGYSLLVSAAQLNGPLTFASVVILAALGVMLFSLVSLLEKLICPWARSSLDK